MIAAPVVVKELIRCSDHRFDGSIRCLGLPVLQVFFVCLAQGDWLHSLRNLIPLILWDRHQSFSDGIQQQDFVRDWQQRFVVVRDDDAGSLIAWFGFVESGQQPFGRLLRPGLTLVRRTKLRRDLPPRFAQWQAAVSVHHLARPPESSLARPVLPAKPWRSAAAAYVDRFGGRSRIARLPLVKVHRTMQTAERRFQLAAKHLQKSLRRHRLPIRAAHCPIRCC